ncbi:MAG: Copper chaperone [uncultured Thermoleophilia bacterium]|uniref:Copper chaperone n=1 Tax=uncultured Thermoleophilia bacterium TaxID=1497501 RepID=A0A6J4TEK1_9ACTN|nr:MAG: Copper chaperone [uncultured Thermoleophilia bacterium]
MGELRLAVDGMTCEHCVRAVTTEVEAVPGVEHVAVDLPAGEVRVTGSDVSTDDVRAAIDEAGYTVRA